MFVSKYSVNDNIFFLVIKAYEELLISIAEVFPWTKSYLQTFFTKQTGSIHGKSALLIPCKAQKCLFRTLTQYWFLHFSPSIIAKATCLLRQLFYGFRSISKQILINFSGNLNLAVVEIWKSWTSVPFPRCPNSFFGMNSFAKNTALITSQHCLYCRRVPVEPFTEFLSRIEIQLGLNSQKMLIVLTSLHHQTVFLP